MRYVWRVLMVAALAVSLGQSCDIPGLPSGQATNGALDGINGISPAGRGLPERGGPVTIQIVSESKVDARVLVRFLVGETESHRSELQVPAFTTLTPIGPDLATVVEVSGTFANDTPIDLQRLILGQDFIEGDFRQIILSDPTDECPEDSAKTAPGVCGCGQPDVDSDGDGTLDCEDLCADDPGKAAPGVCGCGHEDTDTDGDGLADCLDQCPVDRNKTSPGVCGCDQLDTDSDGDSTPDCADDCPLDIYKTIPGECGCGQLDTDSDGDGTLDCGDGCPLDLHKTTPGACGCGHPDADLNENGIADCLEIDTDEDGILDDGDFSGVAGDNPCINGMYIDCDDNCPLRPNSGQSDWDYDGIGSACEIRADLDYDGDIDMDDFGWLQRCLDDPSSVGMCYAANVDNDPLCQVNSADMEAFSICFTGPGVPPEGTVSPACYGEETGEYCYFQARP